MRTDVIVLVIVIGNTQVDAPVRYQVMQMDCCGPGKRTHTPLDVLLRSLAA